MRTTQTELYFGKLLFHFFCFCRPKPPMRPPTTATLSVALLLACLLCLFQQSLSFFFPTQTQATSGLRRSRVNNFNSLPNSPNSLPLSMQFARSFSVGGGRSRILHNALYKALHSTPETTSSMLSSVKTQEVRHELEDTSETTLSGP